MLGLTVALGDDFVELLVFSAMLGSTVALGDDFVEMVVFSALLGSTLDTILLCIQRLRLDSGYMVLPVYVAIPQVKLLDKVVGPVVCAANALIQWSIKWRCRSCSSSSRSSTSPSVRRDSFPWSHYSETIEVSVAVH